MGQCYFVTCLYLWISCFTCLQAGIGYFWHVTDFHYDANATGAGDNINCWGLQKKIGSSSSSNSGSSSSSSSGGGNSGNGGMASGIGGNSAFVQSRYGHYRCDATWHLISSAVQAMKAITGEDIEFILWTGDSAARWTIEPGEGGQHRVYSAVRDVSFLLRRHFPGTAVYPVIGGADIWPRGQTPPSSGHSYKELADLWRIWLPPEAEATFRGGGYYVIEQAKLRLHLVALNTNLYSEVNHVTADSDDMDPAGQWKWLESILLKAKRRKGTVYIFGHVPPGIYERHYSRQALHWFQDRFNQKYLQLVQTYSDVIAGQFFGHAHTDSFRVIYNDSGHPVSWILLSPAVTPREPSLAEGTGANNPAIRLVKFNTDSGQVLDYTQYYLNLTEANLNGRAEWRLAYNFTRHYGMPDVNAMALNNIANAMLTSPHVFHKYYTVNSVLRDNLPFCGTICRHVHHCAATQLDYSDYDDCIARSMMKDSAATANLSLVLYVVLVLHWWITV